MTGKKTYKQATPRKSRLALVFEELEPRLLLSADLPVDIPAALAPDRGGDDEPVSLHEDITTTAVTVEQYAAHELVFVDTDTPDYQLLVDDLLSNSSEERLIEVVLLDNSSDGIAQVTDTLIEYHDLDAVHLISHGSDGFVNLGDTQLEFESLLANSTTIQGWSNAFSESGDLLIYGCNLAASEDGQALVDGLARLTSADVAASDDLTGSTTLGGDWELEYQQGKVETSTVISSATQSSWNQVLAVAVGTSSSGSTADQASVTVSHTTSGTNRLMLVGVSMESSGAETVSSITYNGVNLSLIGTQDHEGGGKSRVEIWGLVAPDTGTHNVVVNLSGSGHEGVSVGVMTFTGVNQTTPATYFTGDYGTEGAGGTASTTVASAANDLVFGVVESKKGTSVTPGVGQTEYWDIVASDSNGGGTTEAGAASVITSWTIDSGEWAAAAVSIQADTNNHMNGAPTDLSLSNSAVDENTDTAGGYSVGTLSAADVDAGDTHSYTIVGGADAALFSIGGAGSDELILDDGILDFETQSSYQVMVRVTDSGVPGLTYDELLTIAVNDQAGNISGTVFTDEGTTNIGAGKTISLLVNGVSIESVVTGAGGAYSFTSEANAGDAVAVFIDNDATYQGITVTVSDGSDLGGIQVFANHIVVRNDNGGATSIADMDNALGAYADPDIHYAVIGGNLVANAVGSEVLVPAGHTFTPGGDVNATSIKILGTVSGGSNTFNIVKNWDSAAGSWFSNTSTVNLIGTGALNSAGGSFYNLTTGAASQVTTLASDLTVRGVLTIADSTGTLTDSGVGYDITVTGTGTPFVNNGAAVTAKNFIYRYPSDATITAAGGTYNVAESLWIAGSGTGSGTTYRLNGDLLVSGRLDVYATSFGVSILDTLGHSITANSLQVSNSAFQVGFLYANNSTIDINGDVDFVNSVTTVVDLGSSDFSVYGNWTNTSNTFDAGTSTVTLDGVNQQLTGSTAFYNLTKVDGSNDGVDSVLTFDITAAQTISGTLTLTGLDADDRINLVSNAPGNQWSINLTAPATHALDYIVVTDSDASGSDPGQLTINPANSFSGGNNIGWFGAKAGDDAYSVDEGSTTNLDLSANDSDPGDGIDLASIVITSGPTNGSIVVNANGTIDYTHDGSETVSDSFTYTIKDTLGNVSNIATVTLTVNPVNDAPVIDNQTFNIDENRPMNAVVGTPVVTDPDAGDTLTYSIIGGTGATAFSIHSNSGQIRVADPSQIDFETNPSLTLDIQVQDAAGLIDTATVTISINDLNERPTLNNATFALDENAPNGTSVGTMTGTDPDGGDSLTYSIIGGNIGNAFTIDPVTGEITVNDISALNFEAIGNATNPAFAHQTGAANPLNGVNLGNRSTPVFVDIDGDGDLDAVIGKYDGFLNFFENIGDAANPSFVEVTGAGNPLDGFDTGSRSTPTFADIDNDGDLDLFVGDRFGGISYYRNVGNATSPAFVQVSGPGNPFDGVNVSNMSAPTLIDIDRDGDLDAFIGEWYGTVKYYENTGDAANPAFTEQTGAANPLNGVFGGICCNEWTPKPTFADLDADGDYDAFIGLKNGRTEYWENSGDAATPVFSLQTGDANPLRTAGSGGGGEAAPALVDIDGDGDMDAFLGNASGTVRFFENKPVLNLTVQAEDGSGLTDTAVVRIDLNDVNEGPTDIDLSNNFIDENIDTTGGYSIGILSTTDEDRGDAHTYSIVGGADATLFTVGGVGADELILDDGVLDFETQNSYQVTVRVTDSGTPGLSYDETVTITVNDLNEAPTDITLSNVAVDESTDTTGGYRVGTLSATDVDAGDSHTFTIVGGADAALFTIGGTGSDELILDDGVLDFETQNSYQVTVRVTDGGTPGLSYDETVTITVNDLNEAPTDISLSNVAVDESTDTIGGYRVGTLSATDVDAGDSHTYTIVGGADAALFTIGGTGSDELILDDGVLDFETQNSYQVTVRVTDSGTPGLSYDETLTITVNDLNDAPVADNDSFTVNEGSTTNLNLVANDTDADDGLDLASISIVSGPPNGSLVVNADGTVDYTHDGGETVADSFTYTIDDLSGATSNVGTVSLSINPVNDAPIHGVPAAQSTPGNAPLTFSSSNGNSITVADPDASGAAMEVTLSASNGTLSLAGTTGLSFDVGDGSRDATMTFTGTATEINTALNGLRFQPDADYRGNAAVQIITDDLGNAGAGGALNALDRVDITVTASVRPGISQDTLPPLDELIIEDGLDLPAPEPVLTTANRVNVDPAAEEGTDAATPASGSVTTPTTDAAVYPILGSGRGVTTHADVSLPGAVQLFDQGIQSQDDDRRAPVQLIHSVIRQGLVDPFSYAKMLNPLQPDMAIWESIEAMMEQMDDDDDSWYEDDQVLTTTTATGLTVSFTVGYVSWMLRAGYLSASLLTVLPLWRELDPLPVLATTQKKTRISSDGVKGSRNTSDTESERIFTSSPSSESGNRSNETV